MNWSVNFEVSQTKPLAVIKKFEYPRSLSGSCSPRIQTWYQYAGLKSISLQGLTEVTRLDDASIPLATLCRPHGPKPDWWPAWRGYHCIRHEQQLGDLVTAVRMVKFKNTFSS
ncbi:hypothetical protein EVAR_47984_1 [Eumeta japonica]|uniref:Uncharacterized protein n=1 Tax=Eumeta variegata TaxID=151549 RepID=A0A4C1XIC8_EUMVA|nr:hypothetical protein EVAR_47984_1 [Eumeta japonica]